MIYKVLMVMAATGVIISGIMLQREKEQAQKERDIYKDRYEYDQRFISNNGLADRYRDCIAEDKKFWGEELFG